MSNVPYRSNKNDSLIRPVAASNGGEFLPYINLMADSGLHANENSELYEYWLVLFRQKGLLIGFALLGALLGYLSSLPQPPIYQAQTSMEVQEINQSFLNMRDLDPNARSYSSESQLQTELVMLESKSLIRAVREKLEGLTQPLKMPQQDKVSTFLQSLSLPPLRPLPTRNTAIAMAASTLRVRNPEMTRIVEIVCDSTDPYVVAEFVNEMTETYVDRTVDGRLASYARVRAWLNDQLEEVKEKLRASENSLLSYSRDEGLGFTGEDEEKLRQLQVELATAHSNLIDRQVQFELTKVQPLEAISEIAQDPVINSYRTSLLQKENELADLSTALKPGHYQIRRLTTQAEELRRKIQMHQETVARQIQSEFKGAELRRDMIRDAYTDQAKMLSEQNEKLIYYNMLKRDVETNRALYDLMSQKVKEANIVSAMSAQNVRIVDPAEPPSSPYKPRPLFNATLGGSVGFFLAIVFVFVRRSSDQRFRGPGESAGHLRVPELGVIPSVGAPSRVTRFQKLSRVSVKITLFSRRARLAVTGPAREVKEGVLPPRMAAEAEPFRALLASVLAAGERNRVIVVTSPSAGSGKTSVLCNLGATLAEITPKVLLIDGDLRKPELHEIFDLSNDFGLTSLVKDEEAIDGYPIADLVQRTAIHNLFVLPSGPAVPGISKLLYSSALKSLLERLRREFDTILIDTAPMLQFTDARVLARLVGDEVILVLRSNRTTKEMGSVALQRLLDDGISVLGTVLNDWDPKGASNLPYGSKYPGTYQHVGGSNGNGS